MKLYEKRRKPKKTDFSISRFRPSLMRFLLMLQPSPYQLFVEHETKDAKLQICDKNEKNRDGALYSMKFNNVYVKNSAKSTTNEGLKDVFTEHGAITSAVMMRDADEKSKCFEFVNFEKVEDVAEVVKTFNDKEIDGEEWYVRKWYMKTGGATFEGNPDIRGNAYTSFPAAVYNSTRFRLRVLEKLCCLKIRFRTMLEPLQLSYAGKVITMLACWWLLPCAAYLSHTARVIISTFPVEAGFISEFKTHQLVAANQEATT
ncbi:hypothetical protein SADUNF_Sadunf08G0130800 [Salix dunnii]|uniref:RRM domain-containing protein n=1 Tax=Salix dunnii TaxID=1413687 RepID=A0A835MSX2_9ROSI|nr:hypothetical protein SADUNF_Sadunf08G0130800 [Salix dunnii]